MLGTKEFQVIIMKAEGGFGAVAKSARSDRGFSLPNYSVVAVID